MLVVEDVISAAIPPCHDGLQAPGTVSENKLSVELLWTMVIYLNIRKVTKAETHRKVASGTLATGKGSPLPMVHRGRMKGY